MPDVNGVATFAISGAVWTCPSATKFPSQPMGSRRGQVECRNGTLFRQADCGPYWYGDHRYIACSSSLPGYYGIWSSADGLIWEEEDKDNVCFSAPNRGVGFDFWSAFREDDLIWFVWINESGEIAFKSFDMAASPQTYGVETSWASTPAGVTYALGRRRSDGSWAFVYDLINGSSREKWYTAYSTGGGWETPQRIDGAATSFYYVGGVWMDGNDVFHVALTYGPSILLHIDASHNVTGSTTPSYVPWNLDHYNSGWESHEIGTKLVHGFGEYISSGDLNHRARPIVSYADQDTPDDWSTEVSPAGLYVDPTDTVRMSDENYSAGITQLGSGAFEVWFCDDAGSQLGTIATMYRRTGTLNGWTDDLTPMFKVYVKFIQISARSFTDLEGNDWTGLLCLSEDDYERMDYFEFPTDLGAEGCIYHASDYPLPAKT